MTRRRTRHRATADRPVRESERQTRCCATPRRPADQDDLLEHEIVEYRPQQCNIILKRQFRAVHIAIGHSDAKPVIAHEGVALAHRFPELPKCQILPVELNMADPPCRHDKRRPVTSDGVSGVITSEWQEPDLCTVGHRRESTVAPGPGPGGPAQMWRTSDPKSEHQGLHLRSPQRTVCIPMDGGGYDPHRGEPARTSTPCALDTESPRRHRRLARSDECELRVACRSIERGNQRAQIRVEGVPSVGSELGQFPSSLRQRSSPLLAMAPVVRHRMERTDAWARSFASELSTHATVVMRSSCATTRALSRTVDLMGTGR